MEFMTEAIEIVGEYGGHAVANPLPFPDPIVLDGAMQKLRVQDTGGVIAERACIICNQYVFELGRMLKEAIYGQVHCGCRVEPIGDMIFQRTNELVAVKIISKAKLRQLSGRTQEDPLKEMSALQFVGNTHPNVMGQICCIENASHYFSVMRFCNGGELYDYVDANGVMAEPMARNIFNQILNGLEHFQTIGICHRDMSLENLMITHDMTCIIIDLGMSLRLPRHEDTEEIYLIPRQGPCGKKNYIAPEVLANEAPFNGFLVDIWAAGVILFILLTGVPPVETASPLDSRYRMIRDGGLRNMLLQWNIIISDAAMDLLQRILRANPRDRLTIEEMRNHPWMTQG